MNPSSVSVVLFAIESPPFADDVDGRHEAAQVLQAVASAVSDVSGERYPCFRQESTRLVVLLAGAESAEAAEFADAVARHVGRHAVPGVETFGLSAGIAEWKQGQPPAAVSFYVRLNATNRARQDEAAAVGSRRDQARRLANGEFLTEARDLLEDNDILRKSAESFGALADRLQTALQRERRRGHEGRP